MPSNTSASIHRAFTRKKANAYSALKAKNVALHVQGIRAWVIGMSSSQGAKPDIDRYLVIHVATTCDEHGVYGTKDSAEVIEIGWLLLDAKNCEEVG